MYKTIFIINIIIYMWLQPSNVLCIKICGLPIFEGKNFLPKRIFSLKNFEFAPQTICSLKNFL